MSQSLFPRPPTIRAATPTLGHAATAGQNPHRQTLFPCCSDSDSSLAQKATAAALSFALLAGSAAPALAAAGTTTDGRAHV